VRQYPDERGKYRRPKKNAKEINQHLHYITTSEENDYHRQGKNRQARYRK